tara:strand:+ start:231 stop:401 length:171 start_codon:yes stop_codon:yes gene_type:complete
MNEDLLIQIGKTVKTLNEGMEQMYLVLMRQEQEIQDLQERIRYLESFIKLGGEEIN